MSKILLVVLLALVACGPGPREECVKRGGRVVKVHGTQFDMKGRPILGSQWFCDEEDE